MNDKLNVSYHAGTDILTIDGMHYSGALFRTLGGPAPVGHWFQVVAREHGVITVQTADADIQSHIERLERELRSAECVVRQAARDTFGKDMTVKDFADAAGYDS